MRTTEEGGNPVRGAICADVDGQGIRLIRYALLGRSGDPSLAGPQPTLQPPHTQIHTVKLRQWWAALCTSWILIVLSFSLRLLIKCTWHWYCFLKHLAHIIGARLIDQGNSAEADVENLRFFAWTRGEVVLSDPLFFPSLCTVFHNSILSCLGLCCGSFAYTSVVASEMWCGETCV